MWRHPEQEEAAGTEGRQRGRKGGSGNDAVASGTGGSIGNGRAVAGTMRKHPEQEEASGTEGRHREQGGDVGGDKVQWIGTGIRGWG